jgi:hypothetical protein
MGLIYTIPHHCKQRLITKVYKYMFCHYFCIYAPKNVKKYTSIVIVCVLICQQHANKTNVIGEVLWYMDMFVIEDTLN